MPGTPALGKRTPKYRPDDSRYQNLNPAAVVKNLVPPILTSHRGGGSNFATGEVGPYPEETIEAFRMSYANGVQSLNVHCQMLADGALVCMHDQTVDRTTTGTGNVYDYDSQSWRTLTFSPTNSGYGVDLGTMRPPFLVEVLKEFGGKIHLFIEATSYNQTATGAAIAKLVAAMGVQDTVTILSFSYTQLVAPAAAGISTLYAPPNWPLNGSDAATIASVGSWAASQPKYVAVNQRPGSSILTAATTSGSPVVNATGAAGAAFDANSVGSPITGTGIPANTFIGTVVSATQVRLSSSASSQIDVNATATATVSVTITVSDTQTAAYITGLIAAGFTICAYTTARRYDLKWLSGLGVKMFVVDEPAYLGRSTALLSSSSTDPGSRGVWAHGIHPDSLSRGSIALGTGGASPKGLRMDYTQASAFSQAILLGSWCPVANPRAYSVEADFYFDTFPTGDTSRWFAWLLSCADDRIFKFGSPSYSDSWLSIFRMTGVCEQWRQLTAAQTSVQFGGSQTSGVTPAQGVLIHHKVAVAVTGGTVSTDSYLGPQIAGATSATLTHTVTLGGTTFNYTFTDSTPPPLLGGYVHLCKSNTNAGTGALIPVAKNIKIG